MKTVPYHIVDVFAESKYQGNQLAVFFDNVHLDKSAMQQMAREINFAESTFIQMSEVASQREVWPVRIFTPAYELPFAGHPTLGTAYIIQQYLLKDTVPEIQLGLGVGNIPVQINYQAEQPKEFWMTQKNPTFGAKFPPQEVAELLGLSAGDLRSDLPVQIVSTGIPFIIVPVLSLEAMDRIKINREAFYRFHDQYQAELSQESEESFFAFFPFAPETHQAGYDINARMLYQELDITEDPATGSANGCLLSYLLKYDYYHKKELNLKVEQGYQIQRVSAIYLKGQVLDEANFLIQVGGKVQMVASGVWIVEG